MKIEPKYWFPAKRHGWGWGLPFTWEGWVAVGAFAALVALGAFIFPPQDGPALYAVYVGGLSLLMMGVFRLKGEPLRGRKGDDKRA